MNPESPAQSQQAKKYGTAMAGEFFALHALHRAGLDASLTLGNAKGVDILLRLASGRSLRLEVKSIRDAGTFILGQPRPPMDTAMFWCLLSFDGHFDQPESSPRAWVIPSVSLRIAPFLTHDKGGYGTTVAKLSEQGNSFLHKWGMPGDEQISRPRAASAMMQAASGTNPEAFYEAAYADNWVLLGLDSDACLTQPQLVRAMQDPAAIDQLDADALACMITALVRKERFVEGTLAQMQATGTLMQLARRAGSLLGGSAA